MVSEVRPNVFAQMESSVQSYARAFPALLAKALGAELWDLRGRRYLDFLAGAGSLNYGHNNPVFKEALISTSRRTITHSLDLHTVAKESFLEAMRDIILEPRGLTTMWCSSPARPAPTRSKPR